MTKPISDLPAPVEKVVFEFIRSFLRLARMNQTSGVAEMLQERLVKHGFGLSRSYGCSLLQRGDDARVGSCGLQKGAEVIVKRKGDAARL